MARKPYCTGCGRVFLKMHKLINHRRVDRCGGRFLPLEEQRIWEDIQYYDNIVRNTIVRSETDDLAIAVARSRSYRLSVKVTFMRKKRLSVEKPDVIVGLRLPSYSKLLSAESIKHQTRKTNNARIGHAKKPTASGVRTERRRKIQVAQHRIHSRVTRRRLRRADRYFNSHRGRPV